MDGKSVYDLRIDQSIISVVASGNSVLTIPKEQFVKIYEQSYVITMNYGCIGFPSHANIWSDKKVSDFLQDSVYNTKEKDRVFIARKEGMTAPHTDKIAATVDYWFDNEAQPPLQGNYTILWLLQILERIAQKNINILIFGLDGKPAEDGTAKWYDKYTQWDVNHRGVYPTQRKLDECETWMDKIFNVAEKFDFKSRCFNCNPNTNSKVFQVKDFKEFIKV